MGITDYEILVFILTDIFSTIDRIFLFRKLNLFTFIDIDELVCKNKTKVRKDPKH